MFFAKVVKQEQIKQTNAAVVFHSLILRRASNGAALSNPSPSAGRSGMEACATGLGLDKASPAAARAPDDRRGHAAFRLATQTPPNHPL